MNRTVVPFKPYIIKDPIINILFLQKDIINTDMLPECPDLLKRMSPSAVLSFLSQELTMMTLCTRQFV